MRTLLWSACLFPLGAVSQSILHYTETSGFDHGTRSVSLALFQDIATGIGATVTDDVDGSSFNTLATLQQFDVVVFSNTSGDAILDPVQRVNFEAYIAGGGSVLGIHAATDTYRHSTANGTNTGVWDFYAELMGASVQQAPNHVSGTPLYDLSHIGSHPSTSALPDPWSKEEEYYYWEDGYYRSDNIAVLEVEETIGPNGLVNSYDVPRPMSWYRALPEGGRMFYTALGHAPTNYTDDTLFQAHVRDALLWLLGASSAIEEPPDILPALYPDPAADQVTFTGPSGAYDLIEPCGRTVRIFDVRATPSVLDLSDLPAGVYFLRKKDGSISTSLMIQR